jgi:hypothetical protein
VDPDPDPGGPKTGGFGSGSATLLSTRLAHYQVHCHLSCELSSLELQKVVLSIMEDGVVMQLYWDCQELRTQLEAATAPADREKLIQQSIKVI